MPSITPQDSALLSSAQEALSYAPHTLGGMGTALISLGLVLWKTGILKGIMDYAKFNKQYSPDDPLRPVTKKDLEDALRPSGARIETISGEFFELKRDLDKLTDGLKELGDKQKDDKAELIASILEHVHKLDISFTEVKTMMDMILKG